MPGAKGQHAGFCGDLPIENIRAMRARGMTLEQIAGIACVCLETVRSCCHRHGIIGKWGGLRIAGTASPLIVRREVTASAMCTLSFEMAPA